MRQGCFFIFVALFFIFSSSCNSFQETNKEGAVTPARGSTSDEARRQEMIRQEEEMRRHSQMNSNSGISNEITNVATNGDSDCYKAEQFICDVEIAIVKLTNEIRSTKGLPPLKHHRNLSFVARLFSAKGIMGHTGFPEQRMSDYKNEFGSEEVSMYGENVAMGGGEGDGVVGMATFFVDMWRNSSGHLSNMLSETSTIGVGVSNQSGEYFATQIFGE